MQRDTTGHCVSATDLANHLVCRHLTQLDLEVANGQRKPPDWHDPALALLQERGLVHERAYVEHLRASGLAPVDLSEEGGSASVKRTRAAMREGADVIVQASMRDGRWLGRADVLLRVSERSELGDWSYEVVDTKLAQETRGGTVLQLCLYSDLVGRIQGRPPDLMHVVKPGEGFERESFRVADYQAYYRLVRGRLEEAVVGSARVSTYPHPIDHCEICRWSRECDRRRREDDHLCLVAGLRNLHIAELQRQGTHTLEQFAEAVKPLPARPERGSEPAFERAHDQARIQLEGRSAKAPRYKLLEPSPGLGFCRLAEPDQGDLFFDIESDPFVREGGLEYLLGVTLTGEDGSQRYRCWWALDRAAERQALEAFVDFVMEQWRLHPGMHVYHYSPYDPAAVKRLIGRHGTREAQLDRLLRGKRFVDLLAVTRESLRASVESYSLKRLEPFYGFRRSIELPDAGAALRVLAAALERGVPGTISEADREAVTVYNRDDCRSTHALRNWLEERRAEVERRGTSIARAPLLSGEASDTVQQHADDVQSLFERLASDLPEDREAWGSAEKARWLLAHQLEYFRREEKCAWWEFFRIHELDHEELMEERKAVAGLRFDGSITGTAKCPIHGYEFPEQEAAIDVGDDLHEVGGGKVGTLHSIDLGRRKLSIKKQAKAAGLHPAAVLVNEVVTAGSVADAFRELARSIADHGVDGDGPYRAARDLLLRNGPRGIGKSGEALRMPGESAVSAGVRLVRSLDRGVLSIQGPPGTGKTFAGARMIVELARAGKRVGVTAVSHKVIRNLLEEVQGAAGEAQVPVRTYHKVGGTSTGVSAGITEITENDEARDRMGPGVVLGGTTWLWSRADMRESVDYLFIDEAGQMSLAHALAAACSARNLVLLGDPQQLEQPQRGAHPEGAEVAALVHVLGEHKTISDHTGLFLDETWRLHPRICEFTSELYYEGRLRSRDGLERQSLSGPSPFEGSGLFYVPVLHQGNQNRSLEEVEAIQEIIQSLVRTGTTWTDADGEARKLTEQDILVVAPYNAQVAALTDRLLARVRVGTVDKFQGQQAPVVLYSMTSSSAEDAPRGMAFLYNPNRLNVATSRARCACILVATPQLLSPDCRTPEQMRWANGLCRFRELAREVSLKNLPTDS